MTNTHFDIEYLRKYVQGELSASEMHRIERATHEDEMLMDIINGLELEYEKKLSIPTQDIKQAVLSRSQQIQQRQTKKIPLWSFSIAASLVFLLGIAAVFYFKDHEIAKKEQYIALTDETPVDASAPTTLSQTDSSIPDDEITEQIAQNKKQAIAENSTITPFNEKTKETVSIDHLPITKNIELDTDLAANEKQLNSIAEEIIVFNSPAYDNKIVNSNQQVLLKNTKATLANTNKPESIAQQRAKLSRMNLDPQTQRALSEALDRQEKEQYHNQQLIASTRLGQAISIDSSSSNALAFRKNETLNKINRAEDGYLNEVTVVSTAKKIKTSYPINGLEKYKNDLILELSKKSISSFEFEIEFSLNKRGLPEHIKFLNSSDPTLETMIIKYLETKESWVLGIDAKKIILEIKQVKK